MSGSVSEVVRELEAKGVRFRIAGEAVRAAPPKPITPDIAKGIEFLRPHKAEVRALLQSKGQAPCGSPDCAGCYEIEPGRKIHPPQSGSCREKVDVPKPRQVERDCWHCNGSCQCGCIGCCEMYVPRTCGVCRGTGKVMMWVQ